MTDRCNVCGRFLGQQTTHRITGEAAQRKIIVTSCGGECLRDSIQRVNAYLSEGTPLPEVVLVKESAIQRGLSALARALGKL